MLFPKAFDVIVVGGGHAGTEAALAAARMGAETLLLTHNIETLGQMSCNPSIGGIGKGHLVKEIDALGGAMAAAADEAGIHFRILNGSKGPAVRATRAQADRVLYKAAIRRRLENQRGLWLFQGACDDLLLHGDRVSGVITQVGIRLEGRAVVLTAGTFLNGRVHVGLESHSGGRAGDAAAIQLSARLKELNLPQGRLKTGTPPRLDGRTIDWSRLVEQPGDGVAADGSATRGTPVFSFLGRAEQHPRQVSCWIAQTNERTHDIVRSGFDRSPMFTGVIEGVGPRYCPSIEDKVNRFADKTSHQIFLEPEGLTTHEVYPNGISTSLPFDVQVATVRSIEGLENAHIVRPGYAIEYDYFDPCALKPSFETRAIDGLFFAGQINGTTGYEEAAAQGLHAGVNAVLHSRGQPAWVPGRNLAYLGVLVDDLVTKGVTEPYRMFTSRAEFRLQLREDNADRRLTSIGHDIGLVDEERWTEYSTKRAAVEAETARLAAVRIAPGNLPGGGVDTVLQQSLDRDFSLAELMRRPALNFDAVASLDAVAHGSNAVSRETLAFALGSHLADAVIEQVEVDLKYAGYVARQHATVERTLADDSIAIPADFPYSEISALSFEVRQALDRRRPATLGEAARLTGVTPAAVSVLKVFLKKQRRAPAGRSSQAA
jgi:tRNA uridine 5-carboxymethylaminomethyl modification enzyme